LSSESAEVGSVSYSVSDLQLDLIPPRGKRKPSKGVISAAPITGEVPSSGKKTGASNPESGGRSGDGKITDRTQLTAAQQFEKDREWDKNPLSKITDKDLSEAFKKGTKATDAWFEKNNYEVVSNDGDRLNCLILSLLQHATGKYEKESLGELKKLAEKIRNQVELPSDYMLRATPGITSGTEPLFRELVTAILKKVGNDEFTPDSVIIVAPNANEEEGGVPVTGGMEIGLRKMIVYGRDGKLHFEAVKKKEGTLKKD